MSSTFCSYKCVIHTWVDARETCLAICVLRNVRTLYLGSDRYCIQCMCILKLCVLLKPWRRTRIYYRQFNKSLSITRQESAAHTHVRTCVHSISVIGSGQIQYTNSRKKDGTTTHHVHDTTNIIVPKLTAWWILSLQIYCHECYIACTTHMNEHHSYSVYMTISYLTKEQKQNRHPKIAISNYISLIHLKVN